MTKAKSLGGILMLCQFNDEPEPCNLIADLLGLSEEESLDIVDVVDHHGFLEIHVVPYRADGPLQKVHIAPSGPAPELHLTARGTEQVRRWKLV